MRKIGIVGVGNILFKDEGIGVFTVKYLQENYIFEPDIDLIDAGTLGFGLMGYLHDYDHIILIDTISVNDKAGSVYRLTPEQLSGLASYHQTAHEVEVLQMIELTPLTGKMADTVIIGVVPERIDISEIGLTGTLEKTPFLTVISQILKELDRIGIKYKKINDLSVEEVVMKHFGSYNGKLSEKRIWNDNRQQNRS
ncbi:hydrogenase maturation protease [Persephonella hydrogeniphila]|uniref:Hydrogenase maturation protease n=1 Tax=Persephonella hydrogeniphila TaxID=198703 RepID=A0A285NBY7_9AQUI|nr:HyaD/HybD family hydrogenase maturation endopeptidase [Persephonella hydrogeniphila]SNZ07014.1 hydrogenase maturation protease [Persephonella hydrogeniphila]